MEALCRQNGIYTICTRHPKNAWHRDLTNGKNCRKRNGKGQVRLHQDKVWELREGAGCIRDVRVPDEPLILSHPIPSFSAEYQEQIPGSPLADLQQFFTGKLYVLVYQLKLPAEELLWLALSWHVTTEMRRRGNSIIPDSR